MSFERQENMNRLLQIANLIDKTYEDGIGVNPKDGDNLPSRTEVIALTEKLLELIYPGYANQTGLPDTMIMLAEIQNDLASQIRRAIRRSCSGNANPQSHCQFESVCKDGFSRCKESAFKLLESLPNLREIAKADVAAAYAGDPAAYTYDEIILSYPGLKAITIQRLAHVLYVEKIPLIPRMMTEYAHSLTGIDIHPGATLGKGIFIDHGTGVVIGETAILGDNVRIYQGVTLGAGNFPKDACGMIIKGQKRHPTIGNNVTIYSGASVLGDVTIGDNSVIGGNVWLTESLLPGTKVTALPPENKLKMAGERKL